LGGHFKIYTDHSALKYLVNKLVLGGNIYIWLLLFQEYDFEVIVKPGRLNVRPDHLSQIETNKELNNLEEGLPDAQFFTVHIVDNHFADIIHFLTTGIAPEGYTSQQKKELIVHATYFVVIAGHFYKMVLMKYCGDMYHILRGIAFFLKLMGELLKVIMQERQLHRRFCA